MAVVVPLHAAGPCSDEDSLTLAELLVSAPLRSAQPEVLAAADRLDTEVRWVHSSETIRVGDQLRGGEVLLTTGRRIDQCPAAQRRFIDEAADRRLSGVILELGDVYQEAPAALVTRAQERGLPLITLGRPVRFVDVTEAAHRRILRGGRAQPHQVENIRAELLALMLEGVDTATLLDAVAQRIGVALTLMRGQHEVLYHAPAGIHTRHEMLEGRAHAIAGRRSLLSFEVRAPTGKDSLELALPCQDRPLNVAERDALREACELLALSLMRRHQIEMLGARERGHFLATLMSGAVTEREAETRIREFGWTTPPFLIPAVVAGFSRDQIREQQDSWSVILQRVHQDLRAYGIPIIGGMTVQCDAIPMIIGAPPTRDTSRGQRHARSAEIARMAAKAFRTHAARLIPGSRGVALGLGEWAPCFRDAGVSLRDAVALTPTTLPAGSELLLDLSCPDVDLLLKRLGDVPVVERFVQQRLAPIENHDRRRNAELMRTLRTFFEHNGKKTETARALYLERQSLYSRLERIESLIGGSLDDQGTRLGLQFALRSRLNQKNLPADGPAARTGLNHGDLHKGGPDTLPPGLATPDATSA